MPEYADKRAVEKIVKSLRRYPLCELCWMPFENEAELAEHVDAEEARRYPVKPQRERKHC